MSQRANPALIGAFVLGAIALVLTAIFLLAGGDFWQKKERYLMYFEDSVYGLQIGAPVVFRGVKIGTVKSIGVAFDTEKKSFYAPVGIEIDKTQAHDVSGNRIDIVSQFSANENLRKDLRAQLATQSLLTGQLYIDLDFHPNTKSIRRGNDFGIPEIPTISTPVTQLKQRLQQIDFEKLFNDVSAIAKVMRQKSESKEFDSALEHLKQTLTHLASITARLDQNSGPLLADTRSALQEARTALVAAQQTLKEVSVAANGMGEAAGGIRDAAGTVRNAVGEDSPLVQNMNRALKETAQAARALRQLSESIDQQPESLLRGKRQGE